MNVRARRLSPFSLAALSSTLVISVLWAGLILEGVRVEHTPIAKIAAAEESAPPAIVHEYIEVIGGCGPHYEGGPCVTTHAGPGEDYRILSRLRKGLVLEVEPVANNLQVWYKVVFNEPVRYPERVAGSPYVSEGPNVRHFYGDGVEEWNGAVSTSKRILVDRSRQRLYAYEGDALFMETSISTGLDITPTPRGTFRVYKKTSTRYMQGPLPGVSDQYYDLPGVPWNLYFTPEGGVIHGAYWHEGFGRKWSHGCVNVPLKEAEELYAWAELGMEVMVVE